MNRYYAKGEKAFDIYYIFAYPFYLLLKILPRFLSLFMWEIFRNTPGYPGIGIRYILLKRLAKRCGKNVAVFPSVFFNVSRKTVIGNHISIREHSFIDGDNLEIGDNVMIAHASTIVTGSHIYDPQIPMRDTLEDRVVTIGDNVWIGAGAKIIGSVDIGDSVIIGANAVVVKSIPSYSVAVGVPAKVIKKLK